MPYLCAFLCWLLSGCLFAESGQDPVSTDGDWTPEVHSLPAGWPAQRWPADNPYSADKAILGRRLFFEKQLSRDSTISCASCHRPAEGFADAGRTVSLGIFGQPTTRNAPTLSNLVFSEAFLFEGGVPTLELQALVPILAHNEMDITGAEIETRLKADTAYPRLFRRAYGNGPITLSGVTKALATYQRTLISYRSPFDRWKAGDNSALSPAARRGADLFLGERGDCWHCHAQPLFTDGGFHDIGLDSLPLDVGRAAVSGLSSDEGKFKTPTLRNVQVTGPYMHDGRFATLREAVEFYNTGGKPHKNRDALMRPLGLTPDEVSDLVAFLEALTDSTFLSQTGP
jgi:cytochrome c peroxidase